MNLDFTKIAPYLGDPLVLIGFVVFLAFLFVRKLLSSGIIPPVGARPGAQIVRLILHYGFVIGLLVICLGFGLKYRELSGAEQRHALGLLGSEVEHNLYVASEIEQNTGTLKNAALAIASSLRIPKLRINASLFPSENTNPRESHDPDRYNRLMDTLEQSGLLNDPEERRRYAEQCEAISRTIDRTLATVESLGDQTGNRYVIQRAAYDAQLPVLRKISLLRLDDLASLYAKVQEQRHEYFRVADAVLQYLHAAKGYCAYTQPNRAELGGALAAEKLSFQLLEDHAGNINRLSQRIQQMVSSLAELKRAAVR